MIQHSILQAKLFSTFVSSPIWCEQSIGTVASQVFLSDQLCPVALILQILKAGNASYQLYPLLLHSEPCIRWWHTQTRVKMRELTLREMQAIRRLKENRKSIRAIAKTKGMDKSRVWKPPSDTSKQQYLIGWENSSWWQSNHKRRVRKITNNFQKAGVMLWKSTALRRFWHRITEATARCKHLSSTKIRKTRLELQKSTKVTQKSFGTVFMDRWDKYESLSKWWEIKSGKKGNCKRSQAYSLTCKAWWGWCHGMDMHGCRWNRPSSLLMTYAWWQ